ncbi:uncharacterized protein [Watersipora subatra]|uniref:uncharacterized protein isoform X2 n=1 Tax=Watersipora subatra TaxID=2589382 RepID=UPI00355B0CF2
MPLLDCFGKGKRNKEQRVPPPSRESIDRPARLDADDLGPPPLPSRYIEHESSSSQGQGMRAEGISADPVPVSPRNQTHDNKKPNIPFEKKLSSEVLATPVPLGVPKLERQEPIGEESGEDYIDPQPKPNPRSISASPHTETDTDSAPIRSKYKASITDDERSKILSDYFPPDSPISKPPAIHSDNSEETESLPDYTNMAEMHESATLSNSGKPNMHLGITSKSASFDSDQEQIKSPRRPRPVPRATGSGNSSRKHSLTNSDSDDSAFAYENMKTAFGDDSVIQRSVHLPVPDRVSPSAPKPKPRVRSDIKSGELGLDTNESLFQTVPPQPASHSQIQQRIAQGYVTEADYVQPSDDLLPHPNNAALLHTPVSAPVDLTARIPTHSEEPGLKNKKYSYLPMDQNPKTLAQKNAAPDHSEHSAHPRTRYNLDTKIPVGNIHDVHVPGYLTVFGATPKPTLTGAYQNISQQSDYINANVDRPALKSRQPNGALPESHYFG